LTKGFHQAGKNPDPLGKGKGAPRQTLEGWEDRDIAHTLPLALGEKWDGENLASCLLPRCTTPLLCSLNHNS
jgi:hypothetical protein